MQPIFYGAGSFAKKNLKKWIHDGIIPICFADVDARKHNTQIHGIEILPLSEALTRFPDAEIVITVELHLKEVYDYLIKQGLSKNKISFITPREWRRGCRFLGKFWQYSGGTIVRPCCYNHGYVERLPEGQRTFSDAYGKFMELNEKILDGFRNGTPTTCDGCGEICEDWWETTPQLNCVSFATGFKGDLCNARCVYCNSTELLRNAKFTSISTLDACKGLAQVVDMSNLTIIFNNGEFSINPDKYEIMRLWEENSWYGLVLTNGVVFEEKLAMLMRQGLAELNCSLDSGTDNTFYKIKGVDKFSEVKSNLRKYSLNGVVTLKYIMLNGINDNIDDIGGFITFAGEIGAKVLISRDARMKPKMSHDEYKLFEYFIKECKQKDIIIDSPLDVFNDLDFLAIKELL